MLIESLGWFILGAGAMAIVLGVVTLINMQMQRRTRRFDAMIADLRKTSAILSEITEMAAAPNRMQIGELTFRDTKVGLRTVKISVDPNIQQTELDPNSDEYVLSAKLYDKLRNEGVEPDEMISNFLKANGRML